MGRRLARGGRGRGHDPSRQPSSHAFRLNLLHFLRQTRVGGADAGFAAIVGLAILVLLYFAHARETENLREQADVLSERLQQAEAKLAQGRRGQPLEAAEPAQPAVVPPPGQPVAPPEVELPAPRESMDGALDDLDGRRSEAVDAAEVVDDPELDAAVDDDEHRPGQIVRRKVHTAHPMSVDDALSRMELVGHDFYLFADAETGAPSVVYRRKGYDYGVIRLAH